MVLQTYFEQSYYVQTAIDIKAAEDAIMLRHPDIIVCDLMTAEGIKFLRRVAEFVPIIMYTDKCSQEDELTALDFCDDFCPKTTPLKILEKRVKLRVKSKQIKYKSTDGFIVRGMLIIEEKTHNVLYGSMPISLTSSEYNLLHFFASHPYTIYSSKQLYEKIWGQSALNTTTVRFHITNLRHKLYAVAPDKNFIVTYQKGYFFAE
jgi:two-component system OmpR family response regulator